MLEKFIRNDAGKQNPIISKSTKSKKIKIASMTVPLNTLKSALHIQRNAAKKPIIFHFHLVLKLFTPINVVNKKR